MTCFEKWCCVLLLVVPASVHAQTAPLWKETLPARPLAFDITAGGDVLLQMKDGLLAVNPETGARLWSRPDVTSFKLVSGTPFVMLATPKGETIADGETGRDRWALTDLGFTTIGGQVHLPELGVTLVYGVTPNSLHTLVAAKYESGQVIWTQASLFDTLGKKASKLRYSAFVLDTDHSIVIDANAGGLMRVDLRTGERHWHVAESDLPGRDIRLHPAGTLVVATYGARAFGIDRESGRISWSVTRGLPATIDGVAVSDAGFLVHGTVGKLLGKPALKPFIAMLDPVSGDALWILDKGFDGSPSFLVEGDKVTVALKESIAAYDLKSGRQLQSFPMTEFSGREGACCLQRMPDGGLRVWSSQNLRLFDSKGMLVYSTYLPAPGVSLATKLAVIGAAAAASGVSMAAASPGGYYTMYTPGPGIFAKFKATSTVERYSYVFTEEDGNHPDRFALVQVDHTSGKEETRVKFTSRVPSFRVDPQTGLVVHLDKDVLSAVQLAPVPCGPSVPCGRLPRSSRAPNASK